MTPTQKQFPLIRGASRSKFQSPSSKLNPFRRVTFISQLSILFLLSSFLPEASAAVLSGAIVSMLETSGAYSVRSWDTRQEGAVGGWNLYNLWFTRGVPGGFLDGLETPFINGPDNTRVSISILLRPGTNQFTLYGESDGVPSHYGAAGLNLFLDGHQFPDISARAVKRTGPAVPAFFPNSSPYSIAMDGTVVPAAATLIYSNRSETVVLGEFFWATPGVIPSNRVGPYAANGPEASMDYIGSLTLIVYPTMDLPQIRVSQVEVSWFSQTNSVYQVVYRSQLTTNIWTSLGLPVTGTGEKILVYDQVTPDEPQRFYRILRDP